MYHLDKGDHHDPPLARAGNQPHMRLSKAASTAEKLVFDFDGGPTSTRTRTLYPQWGDPVPGRRTHRSELDVLDGWKAGRRITSSR